MFELRKALAPVSDNMKYMEGPTIKMKLIGAEGDKWPILNELWDFYNKKGIKTVFFSIGNKTSATADLDIAETLGCPINIFHKDEDVEILALWEEVKQILKSRKRPDTATAFSEGADTKWVLLKNIRYFAGIPSFGTFPTAVKNVTSQMNITDERIDIMKISLENGGEKAVLYAMLDSKYRPGLVMVKWSEMPDSTLAATLCAGHLQTSGYTLIATNDNNFTYLYNDRCMYEMCSWETNNVDNPMIAEVINATKAGNQI